MIILNELEYAENCICNNDIGKNPYNTLSILSRYYYHHLGYKKSQIVTELTEFISNNYSNYQVNKNSWNDSIEKLASNAKKYKLYEIEGIWITKSEMATIQEIHNKVLERLAFTMLCLAKLALRKNDKSNGWVNADAKIIFSLARISGSVIDRYRKISNLTELGLLELPKKNGLLSYRVTFIDNESENELFIHDFRELGYEYLKYCGQNIIRCVDCGILVRGNKATTKRYCSACSGGESQKTKIIVCVDCGTSIVVSAKNNKTSRCNECQQKMNKVMTNMRVKKYRKLNEKTKN